MMDPDETLIRRVADDSGRLWYVYVVLEGKKPGSLDKRRRNWLCIETGKERRYLSPVPEGWQAWTEQQLLDVIPKAKPDLRS